MDWYCLIDLVENKIFLSENVYLFIKLNHLIAEYATDSWTNLRYECYILTQTLPPSVDFLGAQFTFDKLSRKFLLYHITHFLIIWHETMSQFTPVSLKTCVCVCGGEGGHNKWDQMEL